MNETISISDMLHEAQRDLENWADLLLHAISEGCSPDQYRHRINCKKGLVALLAALAPLEEGGASC
jgi:hypothetical protein